MTIVNAVGVLLNSVRHSERLTSYSTAGPEDTWIEAAES